MTDPVRFTDTFQHERNTPSPSSVNAEEERLREAAEREPRDPFAMAAYSRFLRYKRNDTQGAKLWQRKAVDTVNSRLSSGITQMVSYHL